MTNPGTQFGQWLKRRRKEFGYTQRELARLVGCSTILIAKIEAGERRPSEQIIELIARHLEAGPEERELIARLMGSARPSASAAAPATNTPNNLPVQATGLVGRYAELDAVRKLLARDGARLVTLTGPAGIGKTRLGLQVATDMLEVFWDGVFFVALSAVVHVELVASAIAQTLGVRETPGRPLLDSLKDYLKDREMLLLLDNFEQVIRAAPLVADLLSSAPGLKVLVTSREMLRLRGEHELAVPPLSLPDIKQLPPPEQLSEYEAVRMFVERAVAIQPDFEVTNDNAPAVAEICVRLDGLPLAIELAAARIKLFSPQAMLGRLGSRLKLLTGGARDLPARQQTMRRAIEWSYLLLDTGEQTLFRRLSVFVGGCTLEAAEAVCANEEVRMKNEEYGVPSGAVGVAESAAEPHSINSSFLLLTSSFILEGVASLVDKSLLRRQDQEDGEPRFLMLETIREYGLEVLAQADGSEGERVRGRHAAYFLDLAERAEGELRGSRQRAWLERLEREHDNLRAALRWARGEEGGQGDSEVALRMSGALWRFWFAHSYLSEGRRALERALESSGSTRTPMRAKALYGAGRLGTLLGEYAPARALYEESLAIYRQFDDKSGVANVLNDLGNLAGLQGDYALKRSLLEESLEIFRELGDQQGIGSALFLLGNAASSLGDQPSARALFEESLGILGQLGDTRSIAMCLYCLGNVASVQGDFTSARSSYEQGLELFRELGDRWGVARTLTSLGDLACQQELYEPARALLIESLSIFRELGARQGEADALARLGNVARALDDHPFAEDLFRQSLAIRIEMGNKRGMVECLEALARVAAETGKQQPPVEAHGAQSGTHAQARAAVLFGAAQALRESIKSPLPPADLKDQNRIVDQVRARLDEGAWVAAWAAGRAMSLDQAVTYALDGSYLPEHSPV